MLAYLRATAAVPAKHKAKAILDTHRKATVYRNMTGDKSQPKISEVTGVAQQTISDWGEEFVANGLATPPGRYYKFHRALFSLEELEIDPRTLKDKETKPPAPTTPGLLQTVPPTPDRKSVVA